MSMRGRPPRLFGWQKAKIIEAYLSGESPAEIARRFKIARTYPRMLAKRAGLPSMRPPNGPGNRHET